MQSLDLIANAARFGETPDPAISLGGTLRWLDDPQSGLDCVGVVEAACRDCGIPARLPAGYALRTRRLPPLEPVVLRLGLLEATDAVRPGDVVMVRPGPGQHHLAIATAAERFVHAHASLRRVVEGPLHAAWPVIGHWRLPCPEN